ncbi:MAG: hypothetical protein IJP74_01745 [Prevotella sp.]|nr:hypothetical protein [Prevotella sp.]
MNYDRQILDILCDVGKPGISAFLLAKHVYNLNCTLFSQPDMAEVYTYVRRFIRRNSRTPGSLLEHSERWGCYRLNTRRSAEARQIAQNFRQRQAED